MRIAIYGFGRIGRLFFRAAKAVDVSVADLTVKGDTKIKNYLHAFRYIEEKILSEDESQIYGQRIIKFFSTAE